MIRGQEAGQMSTEEGKSNSAVTASRDPFEDFPFDLKFLRFTCRTEWFVFSRKRPRPRWLVVVHDRLLLRVQ